MPKFLIIAMLLIPTSVFSQESTDVRFFIEGGNENAITIEQPAGSKKNLVLIVENNTSNDVQAKIYLDTRGATPENKGSLYEKTLFFDDDLADSFRAMIDDNEGDIVQFCSKSDLDQSSSDWCQGKKELSIELDPDEKKRIPLVVTIDPDEKAHDAEIVLAINSSNNDLKILGSYGLSYMPPQKDIVKFDIVTYDLMRKFGPLDIWQWFLSRMKEVYRARFSIENTGTMEHAVTYSAIVNSQWIGEDVYFEDELVLSPGEKQDAFLDLTMPRFGKVNITGSISYKDAAGNEGVVESEKTSLVIWPATLLIIVCLGGCFCFLTVLLYRYINKNMFGFIKKKKKSEKEDVFTGTYIVKDADNIISIAQRFDVPWKELAKINEIEPPYILISGEKIRVPDTGADQEKQHENGDKQEKDLTDQGKVMGEDQSRTSSSEPHAAKKDLVSVDNRGVFSQSGAPAEPPLFEDSENIKERPGVAEAGQDDEKKVSQAVARPKKRKVTFASPKNMLTKPSSEPTTRAIDIEWMRDDEVAYLEEMEVQEKKTSRMLISIIVVLILLVIGLISWGVMWFLNNANDQAVSVDTLIDQQKEDNENIDLMVNMEDESQNISEDADGEELFQDEAADDKDDLGEQIIKSDVSIQVLNAGAAAGSAGEVTNDLESEGYSVRDAKNAQNDYENVTIYYGSELQQQAEIVAADINENYGEQNIEESQDVVDTYDVDIVIVLGS